VLAHLVPRHPREGAETTLNAVTAPAE
jgi:hypothetical protein